MEDSATTKRLRYLPLPEVDPGMVLARPLRLLDHGQLVFSLPSGHVLTETNLKQLRRRHAQYACVFAEETRGEAERERQTEREIKRTRKLFQGLDLEEPETRAFFEAVLTYRCL